MSDRHPITGCRADSIFGLWLYPPEQLDMLNSAAWMIVSKGELARVSEESKQLDQKHKETPYRIEDGIAHFEISGPMTKYPSSFSSVMGGCSTVRLRESVRQAKNDPNVKAGFVHIDSSGGTAEGTSELVSAFKDFDAQKPLHMHAEDKAMSGALWAACGGRKFTCGPAALVGSQGAISMLYDTSSTPDKGDGKPVVVTSSNAKFKSIGAPGVAVSDEHIKEIQRRLDGINAPFKQDVVDARKLNAVQTSEVATARVFVGADALRVGLVDGICTTNEALSDLKQTIANPEKHNPGPAKNPLVVPQAKRSLSMLTAEQLVQVRQLPGGASVADDQADVFLLSSVKHFQSLAGTNQTAIAQLTETQNELARVKALVPVPMNPEIAKAKCEVLFDRLDLMAEKQQILPTQVAAIKLAVKASDGKINETLLSASVQDLLVGVLKENKPHGLLKDISGGQPAPKSTPGAEGSRDQIPTFKICNENRRIANLPQLSVAEYKQKYGVDPQAA